MRLPLKYYTSAFAQQTKIKLGLETVSNLDKALGFPSKQFRSIHIAGTNGKGSVTTKMAAALTNAGYKVGRYTSPHLRSFHERIWVAGESISDALLHDLIEEVGKVAESLGIEPTFFEWTTLVAFLYFARQKVDFAVIEVGMGGRLDATNIIEPILSVITSIDYDHKEHLGETLEKIAFEKAGIIKQNIPVVVGAGILPLAILQDKAKEYSAPLYIADPGKDFEEQNQKSAEKALSLIQPALPQDAIEAGLKIRPPCRFQKIREKPLTLLDVAHNPAGVKALLHKMEQDYPGKEIVVVAAFSSEEKAKEMIRLLLPKVAHLYVTKAQHERGVEPPFIAGAEKVETVEKALLLAKQKISLGSILLITGTFFMMEEVFSFFEKFD